MGYVTIATLIITTITLLIYGHTKMSWSILPKWLQPSQSPNQTEQEKSNTASKPDEGPAHVLSEEAHKDGEATPKAISKIIGSDVPSFTLSDGSTEHQYDAAEELVSVPSFPALNSAQRAAPTVAKKDAALSTTSAGPSIMPPPPRPAVKRGLPPSSASGLRIPSTGPLPNRGPPQNSQQRVNGGLSANGTDTSIPNPRGKVLLSPGHSPMDWAALTRSGNISGVHGFQRVTPSQLKKMTGRKGKPAWSSWQGKVYNITPYLPFHPGGEPELMKAAGRDGTKLFMDVHPWVNWENMLSTCMVGVLVPEEESPLEAMD